MQQVRPYRLFQAGALVLFAASFMIGRSEQVDFYLYDTYYVVSLRALSYAFILLFLLFVGLYKAGAPLFRSTLLNWFHVSATMFTGLVAVLAPLFLNRTGHPIRYVDFNFWTYLPEQWYASKASVLLLLLFLGAQVAFLLNAGAGGARLLTRSSITR